MSGNLCVGDISRLHNPPRLWRLTVAVQGVCRINDKFVDPGCSVCRHVASGMRPAEGYSGEV